MCGHCLSQGAGHGASPAHKLPQPLEGWLHSTPQPKDTAPPAAALRPPRPAGARSAQPPRGTGPRRWPGGFWSEAQSLCLVLGSRTWLTVLGKWLPPLPQPVSPSALSGKSLLLLWGRLPLCPPGLKGRSPPFSVGLGGEAGWSWGNQQERPEADRPMGPVGVPGLVFGRGMQGLVPLLQGRRWGAGQRLVLTRGISKPRAPCCELHALAGRARQELRGSAGAMTRPQEHRGQPEGRPWTSEREGSHPLWAEGPGGHS